MVPPANKRQNNAMRCLPENNGCDAEDEARLLRRPLTGVRARVVTRPICVAYREPTLLSNSTCPSTDPDCSQQCYGPAQILGRNTIIHAWDEKNPRPRSI